MSHHTVSPPNVLGVCLLISTADLQYHASG